MPELAGGDPGKDTVHAIDGISLVPSMAGGKTTPPHAVVAEFCAEQALSPCLMIRREPYKFIYCADDPPLLFNLDRDPDELDNLAEIPDYKQTLSDFQNEITRRWDPVAIKADILDSRRRRAFIFATHTKGKSPTWDYVVDSNPPGRYQRIHVEPWQTTEQRTFMRNKR